MSLEATNAIKGIFAVIILYSHLRQYLVLSDTFVNNSYIEVLKYFGQMMVTMYLFYSGYGLMESLRRKPNYRKNFLRNRFLKILLHFDIAVLMYIILQFALGKKYSLLEYLGSLIGWNSIGNSNWFIFDILVLYLIFYLSMYFVERFGKQINKHLGHLEIAVLLVSFVFCLLLWYFLHRTKGQSWWMDNIMAFPLGMGYSLYRSKLENWLKSGWKYFICFSLLSLVLLTWRHFKGVDIYGVCTCLFAMWVVLLSMKVKFDNEILQWLGVQAFAIYILQRLPMIAFSSMGINHNAALYCLLVIPAVFLIAFLYTKFLFLIDRLSFC
jgi:membrane-bound acyltransferase YfiQ involved in biofilm formation